MENTVIMTGGYPSRSRVQEYDLVGATDRDLPDLIKGRQDHACGHYVHNGKTVIILQNWKFTIIKDIFFRFWSLVEDMMTLISLVPQRF